MIEFTIPGAPVAKGRPRFARRGAFVTAYTPEKTVFYENLVKIIAKQAMQGNPPTEGAMTVRVELRVPIPASWSQKKQRAARSGEIYPTGKPDADNTIKGLFDACNLIVWRDDSQICDISARKRYSDTPCAIVTVDVLEAINP